MNCSNPSLNIHINVIIFNRCYRRINFVLSNFHSRYFRFVAKAIAICLANQLKAPIEGPPSPFQGWGISVPILG